MRTAVLGALGLALAVAVGFGVHLVTRSTISLPVVQLEQPSPVALRPATAAIQETTTRDTTTRGTTTIETPTRPSPATTEDEDRTETTVETDEDDSGPGRGRGRNRGRGGGDD